MSNLDLARWQFAITTVYHFLFVPITIGTSAFVAALHTIYLRNRKPEYLRLSKFFGKLLAINVALGLATGIVQEFQFGMNWSAFSRFIGDIFGAPLALEALLAFFVESTFLGLWLFGWGKIPEKLHNACIWIVHLGTLASAYFILAANSFMQHPVGFRVNPSTGRAEMTDFVAILTNKVQIAAFPHVVTASYMVAGSLAMVVGLYNMRRRHREGDDKEASIYRPAVKLGAILTLVAGIGVAVTGDLQGKVMTEVQPMKMAAAEALYETPPDGQCANFSVLSVGPLDGSSADELATVPCLLSFLGTGSFDGKVEGINNLQSQLHQTYSQGEYTGATSYVPNVPIAYWNFRFMITAGMASAAVAAFVLFSIRKNRIPMQRWWGPLLVLTPLGALFGNSFGWIFTETARQPWLVYGLFTTSSGVSPGVSSTEIIISMSAFTLLYAVLAVIEIRLLLRYIRRGAEPYEPHAEAAESKRLAFSY
ncbi:cytochrome ubiquinol oxidase subunit I [Dermacoccaceae bacterium W4C1]